MKNGDLDAKGVLSGILYAVGTTESFKVSEPSKLNLAVTMLISVTNYYS